MTDPDGRMRERELERRRENERKDLEVENEHGAFQVRKHTVIVNPAQRISYAVTADALGRWAYHCHLLYHMEAGMFREVVVT